MPRFEVRQSAQLHLTTCSGLALIGLCCEAEQVEMVIDPHLLVSQGMKTSNPVKAMTGLLSLSKSDFEAIEPFRIECFFKEALSLPKIPSSAWMPRPKASGRTVGAAAGANRRPHHPVQGLCALRG